MKINYMQEWRLAKGYESLFKVGSLGGIIGIDGNIPKTQLSCGYTVVYIPKEFRETKSSYIAIHRLVALTFIDNPSNKKYVDHINRDRSDNSVTNLRWATPQENSYNRPDRSMSCMTKNDYNKQFKDLGVGVIIR